MRRLFFVFGLALLAQPASADVQDYCAAYARDFADLRPKNRDIWQQRYDSANADCVEQFSGSPAVTAETPKVKMKTVAPRRPAPVTAEVAAPAAPVEVRKKTKTKKPVVEEKPSAEVASVEGATAEPTAKVAGAKPKLAPGSAAWLDYCERKYTSFNRAKGTYLSKTGVERKCLITTDFR